MTSTLQHFPQHSLITWLTVLVTWLHLTAAVTVHLKYTSRDDKGSPMPDELNVTLSGEPGAGTDLKLRLAQNTAPNVPVYTLKVDTSGRYIRQLEELEDEMNIAFYQDLSNEAVIQVTRTGGRGGSEAHFELKGELKIKGRQFALNPDGRHKREAALNSSSLTEGELYILVPQEQSRFAIHDYVEAPPELELEVIDAAQPTIPDLDSTLSPRNISSPSQPQHLRRRRSGSALEIFVDVAAVIDYACYNRFSTSSRSRNETLQAMREHYAFIFNGVDLRYKSISNSKYTINVRLIRLIIAETPATSTFTEQFRESKLRLDEVDAHGALEAFANFAVGPGQDLLFPHDHAMLFTGYELTSMETNGVVEGATAGLAYLSTLCRTDGKSVSIVEDRGGFQPVGTAAHELGHSLSAAHDGDGNACRPADRFIMSPGGYEATSSNDFNPWLFSNCSIASFINFIGNKLKTVRGKKCLTEKLTASGVPDVRNRLPGQQFSPDEQCRMIFGNASRLCRGDEFSSPSQICTSMYCYDPSTSGTCFGYKSARGTTCGDGKLCLNGRCVSDSRAPSVDEDCVFGDQPGIAFEGQTCSDFVEHNTGLCYQSVIRSRCCGSCKAAYKDVKGCEYGDSAQGCYPGICRYATARTLSQCCRTCGSMAPAALTGSRISVTREQLKSTPASAKPRISVTKRQSRSLSLKPSTRPSVRSTIQRRASTPPSTLSPESSPPCLDNPIIRINHLPCRLAAILLSRLCHSDATKDLCCASCRKLSEFTQD